jgi:hypothetical protein
VRDKQNEASTVDYLLNYYSSTYFTEFPMRFRIVVFDNFQLMDGLPGIIIAAMFFLCVIIPFVWLKAWRNIRTVLTSNHAVLAFVFLFVAMGCYLILPDKLPGQTPLFQRFTTIVMLITIICCSVLLGRVSVPVIKYFSCVVVVIYSVFWLEYLYSFNKQNEAFNPDFFSSVEAGNDARIAGLIYDSKYRGRKVYIHYPNYFLVWNKGVAASKIIDYRFGLVRRVAPESTLPFYNELIGDGYRSIDAYHELEYLLVRGTAPKLPDVNLAGFDLVKEADVWKLYKNTQATLGE